MPEEINTPSPTDDGGGGEPTTPAPQHQQGPPPGQPPKVVSMPTHAIGKLKDEAFAKGQQAAIAAFAQQAGYTSPEELAQALGALKQKPTPPPAARQPPAPDDEPGLTPKELAESKDARRMEARYQRQLEGVTAERNKFQQQLQKLDTQAKASKEEAEALRAEMYLRTMAAQKGVQDIDYAITLFSRRVENLTPEEAEKFDESAFFEELRKSKPLLFGETVVAANTGTSPGQTPGSPPKPAAVAAAAANGAKPDIRKMNPQEFAAELRKRGINGVSS